MNLSGKFSAPASHKAVDEQVNVQTDSEKLIPPVPSPTTGGDIMDVVKEMFGKFWWLWLVLLVWWLMKGK